MSQQPTPAPDKPIVSALQRFDQLQPLTVKTAIRFIWNFAAVLAFMGGIWIFLFSLLGGCMFVFMLVEELSLFESFYFTMITALTIGYGDIAPESVIGRILSAVVGLIGMLMTGIIIATAVRSLEFTVREELQDKQHERSHAVDKTSAELDSTDTRAKDKPPADEGAGDTSTADGRGFP